MITKPFFLTGKDAATHEVIRKQPAKRPPEGGLFGSADGVLKSGYMERATPPPITLPSRPKSNLCGASKPCGVKRSVPSEKVVRRCQRDTPRDRSLGRSSASEYSVVVGRTLGRGGPLSAKPCRQIVTLAANCSQNS